MATFPTAEELQRPVPRVDGSIPTYQVTPTSDAGPRAMAQTGQTIQSLGQDVGQFAERLDMTDAQDALNKFRQKRQELTFDPDKGFMRLKGRDAIGKGADGKSIMDTTASSLDTEAEALAKNLSPRAAAAFRARAINETTAFKTDLVKYQISEGEKYEKVTYATDQAMATDRAIRSADNPAAFEANLGELEKRAEARAAREGVPAELYKKAAVSDAISFSIKQKIAEGDSAGAIALHDRYKDRLDPKDNPQLTEAVETLKTGQGALAFAHGGSGGSPNENNIGNVRPAGGGPNSGFQKVNSFDEGVALTVNNARAYPAAFNGGKPMTLQQIGQRWAPAGDGKNDPLQWAKNVASGSGLPVDQPINLNDPETAAKFARGVHQAEWGKARPVADYLPGASGKGRAAAVPSDNRIGDPLATQINAVTAGRAPPSLESAVNAADEDVVIKAQGVPNARQQLILINDDREKKLADNYALFTDGKITKKQYDANQAAVNTLHAQRTQQVDQYKLQLWDAIQTHMNTGNNGKPATSLDKIADLVSQIDPRERESLQKQADRNLAGAKPVTDWGLYTEIQRRLTSPAQAVREEAAKLHPMQFRGDLADEQYNKILELQAAINKGDPDGKVTHAQTIDRKIKERLGEMKVQTGEKAPVDDRERERRFTEVVENRVAELEKGKGGKKALPAEIDSILNDLTYEVTGSGGWFSRNVGVGSTKRAYEVPGADPSKFIVTMKNISMSDIGKITEALKAEGKKPTDENVIKRYRLHKWGIPE